MPPEPSSDTFELDSPLKAVEHGYDGCGTCLRFYNTD